MRCSFHFFEINSQLIFLSILLPSALLLNYTFGFSSISSLLMFLPVLLIFLYIVVTMSRANRSKIFSFHFAFMFLVFFTLFTANLIASEDKFITLVKFFSFFSYLTYAYLQFIPLKRKISLRVLSIAINISLLIFLVFAFESISSTYVGQTVGMYAGVGVIIALFAHATLKDKLLYSLLPCFMLVLSASRGSMLILGILLAASSIFMIKKKSFWKGLFLLSIISVFARPDIIILNSFSSKILYADRSSEDSLLISALQRSERAMYGMQVFSEKPILGIGVGSDIGGKMYQYLGKEQTPHNGYVTLLVEGGYLLGLPTLLFVIVGSLKILGRAVKNPSNLTIAVVLFILYYLARALGENYLLYNFGNFVSIIFILIIVQSVFSRGDYPLKY